MKSVYLLISKEFSPVAITFPKVVAAYETRKQAQQEAERRNAVKNNIRDYWVERAVFHKEETEGKSK